MAVVLVRVDALSSPNLCRQAGKRVARILKIALKAAQDWPFGRRYSDVEVLSSPFSSLSR
jgi:hypothetical protein